MTLDAQKVHLNLSKLKKEIGLQAKLVVVTKRASTDEILCAYNYGIRDFAENRLSFLLKNRDFFIKRNYHDIIWHFIGNLQSSKINRLFGINNLRYIHSVDSPKLLSSIYKREQNFVGDELFAFLQVNTSCERQKNGMVHYDDIASAINMTLNRESSKIKVIGLMTMAAIRTDDYNKTANECFKKLVDIKQKLENDFPIGKLKLSMGMSMDYKIAIKYGSDFLRIGSKIFE